MDFPRIVSGIAGSTLSQRVSDMALGRPLWPRQGVPRDLLAVDPSPPIHGPQDATARRGGALRGQAPRPSVWRPSVVGQGPGIGEAQRSLLVEQCVERFGIDTKFRSEVLYALEPTQSVTGLAPPSARTLPRGFHGIPSGQQVV